ncbi:MAG: phosphoglucomutase [Actinomycetota bacterium]|jgi:phosphomannomutase
MSESVSTETNEVLRARAEAWWAVEPDDDVRDEIARILNGPVEDLRDRFSGGLTFGTAGLRAAIGAGPRRMNRLVVRQAAAGLVDHLLAEVPDAAERGLVIGWDARRKSDDFALDTARVAAARGMRALLLPEPVPTPVLAWNITRLGCAAGVMVTASHNPPADNGYKVYLDSGAQIVPPHDDKIARAIAAVDPTTVPLASLDDPRIVRLDRTAIDDYVSFVPSVTLVDSTRLAPIGIAYTALHGVGGEMVQRVFAAAGYDAPVVVASQQTPDGSFPTVSFPNPEEPGAMDEVVALARSIGADVALANDPDADRLGVAIPTSDGGWRLLSGDEVGWLFADHVLTHTTGDDRLIVSTLVSSSLVGRMAEQAGVHYEESFTGFKWIADVARRHPELRLVFAYEQALGYLIGGRPLDKDGIGAALVMAEITRLARTEGSTLENRLADIARRFGRYVTAERSVPMSPERGRAAVARLERSRPESIGGHAVESMVSFPEASLVRLVLTGQAGSIRVQIRPSGTEPKVKLYGEAIGEDPTPYLDAVRQTLAA